MTTADTTYFNSNPHFWEHQQDPNKHHNSFHFMKVGAYRPGNYSQEEVTAVLERVPIAIGMPKGKQSRVGVYPVSVKKKKLTLI